MIKSNKKIADYERKLITAEVLALLYEEDELLSTEICRTLGLHSGHLKTATNYLLLRRKIEKEIIGYNRHGSPIVSWRLSKEERKFWNKVFDREIKNEIF